MNELLLIALTMVITGLIYKLVVLLAECDTPKDVVFAVAVMAVLVSTISLASIFEGVL